MSKERKPKPVRSEGRTGYLFGKGKRAPVSPDDKSLTAKLYRTYEVPESTAPEAQEGTISRVHIDDMIHGRIKPEDQKE